MHLLLIPMFAVDAGVTSSGAFVIVLLTIAAAFRGK
jgi:hypothetical protein